MRDDKGAFSRLIQSPMLADKKREREEIEIKMILPFLLANPAMSSVQFVATVEANKDTEDGKKLLGITRRRFTQAREYFGLNRKSQTRTVDYDRYTEVCGQEELTPRTREQFEESKFKFLVRKTDNPEKDAPAPIVAEVVTLQQPNIEVDWENLKDGVFAYMERKDLAQVIFYEGGRVEGVPKGPKVDL